MKKNTLLSVGLFLFAGMILHAQSTPGLYVGDAFQGEMDLYDSLDWIAANAQESGDYSIVLGASIAASSSVLDYGGKSVTVSLKSSSETLQVSYATRSPTSSLFTVKSGVTFVLENGVELVGRPSASRPPVTVDGGNFIMNGGAVKDSKVDHSRDWLGGGVDVVRGAFTMNDGVISGNSAGSGAGVNVGENTTFTMNGGAISGNSIGDYFSPSFGGGVFVNKNATFTMNGGTISRNSAFYGNGYGGGGGVYVNGTFTMVDGIISNNGCSQKDYSTRGKGGGVCVSGNGVFVMQGGAISNNSDTGVYLTSNIMSQFVHIVGNGKITMDGGIITGNAGGGVCIEGSFEMNNGTISKNTANAGAGVYVNSGTFNMNDGSIIENTANGTTYSQVGGGGIYVGGNGTFEMKGGVIAKNVANKNATGGGGVFVDGKFMMNAGTISGNSTTKSGGGVLVDSGTFTKSNTAGVIYGGDAAEDKANKADQYGHAVHTKNGSRDTTARATMALDSRKQGAEGGWE